ncbi:helix-turn-helix domain-containing protein [Vibrio atypicus]|uniref:helix-turn-helix domain-containing protein n=1 Tax=Vibrio atypicus TaxID=558271 RepID=UPI001357F10A|nr:AraC family transcriptional regulator [Vibrio atypicus]
MRQFSFIYRIVETVETRLPCKLNINAIATTLNVSRWHLQHEFKRYTGIPLGRYYRLRLLTLAIDALASSERNVLDIALEHGFESQEALYRAVRQNFLVSPKHFKRNPTLAKFFGVPPIDSIYLSFFQRMQSCPPEEVTFPADTFFGVVSNFSSVFFDEKETGFKVEQMWQTFAEATSGWQHQDRRYYALEYRNNCSVSSGQFQMLAVCNGEQEGSLQPLARIELSQRKMWRFNLSHNPPLKALFVYLNQVFCIPRKLTLKRLPYIWQLDENGNLLFWVELRPFSKASSLPDSIQHLSRSPLSNQTLSGRIETVEIPAVCVEKSQRLAFVLNHFKIALPAVNAGAEQLMIGRLQSSDYSPDHDYQVSRFTIESGGSTHIKSGMVLKCVLQGCLSQIGEDLDSLYYSYLHEVGFVVRKGLEWIVCAEEQPGQVWYIELLIPVIKR